MKKHVIDTDLYVDLIRTGENHLFIREIYEKETPGIYFSSDMRRAALLRWSTGFAGTPNPGAAIPMLGRKAEDLHPAPKRNFKCPVSFPM
jgi:hypothetical protein